MRLFIGISFAALNLASGFDIVVSGNSAIEVQLIAGKLAAREGDRCSIIGPADRGFVGNCQRLLYGRGSDPAEFGGPAFVSTGEEIGEALETAQGLIIVCEDAPFADTSINTMIENAPELQHIAVMTQMGGGLKQMEEKLRATCSSAGLALSIVRAGILKGGGCGREGNEFGLNKHYYDTLYELQGAMNTMSFDKFTLGAAVTQGDPFKFPNFFQKLKSAQSFQPADTDTGRIAAATALLRAVKRSTGVDISVSSAKGEEPPTAEEWESLLGGAEA